MLGVGSWQNNISVAVALEYEDVLKRPGLVPHLSDTAIDDFLEYLFAASNLVQFVPRVRPSLPDADDECILEVAVECRALIVTHNLRDFAGAERL